MIWCNTAGNGIMLILQHVQTQIQAVQAKLGSELLEPERLAWRVINWQQFGNPLETLHSTAQARA